MIDAVDILNDVINKLREENERMKFQWSGCLKLLNDKGNKLIKVRELLRDYPKTYRSRVIKALTELDKE